MNARDLPTLEETVLGVCLHDIGKFMQRAHGSLDEMDPEVRRRADDVLPKSFDRPTHWHALWTDAFFEKLGHARLPGVRLEQVRNVAVYHHKPGPNIALTELAAEADRLAAGMDRKPRDESRESESDLPSRRDYVRTAMKNPFSGVDLGIGLGEPPNSEIPLVELTPGEALLPQPKVETADYEQRYRKLWQEFFDGFVRACSLPSFDLFAEAVLWLSERYTFAIPSSTVDQPDISLHDHQRAAAAVAAALYRWHEQDAGGLNDTARIRDRSLKKFRFLAGDLSGIQRSLFRLAAEQVKGLNKILRARSLLIALTAEAAALACRRALRLPVFSVLQNAGGRFLLLVPNLAEVEDRVQQLRQQIDPWMRERYLGDLALILALSEPFGGEDLLREKFPALLEELRLAVEKAKLRAFEFASSCVQRLDYPYGECRACGVRPARDAGQDSRCVVCEQEHELGGALPRLAVLCWRPAGKGRIPFFGEISLDWRFEAERAFDDWLSAFRLYGASEADERLAVRYVAGYVPRLQPGESQKPAYRLLSEEAREVEVGEIKTFEHIALDGLEAMDGELLGEPLLAVFKADVDRLGAIFSFGLRDQTLSRFAALSRWMDLFFTAYLPDLLARQFSSMYTVYAGGDDMLLIGPWRETLRLGESLYGKFRQWTGWNPNVTLSAGIELLKPQHPVGPAVSRAEGRLEVAKRDKNRVSAVVSGAIEWDVFANALEDAESLNRWLRQGLIHTVFLHRVLYFAEQRQLAESVPMDLKAADWSARWGYYLARQLRRLPEDKQGESEELRKVTNRLLGLDADLMRQRLAAPPRLAVTVALYRNRNPRETRR
ncbi:MAG: type III-A CRISPR-associated protein Cas10/Csm1 [Bryobacterales bacterium]|nr:type III-A CRISPR-associated protein Cas10/Csm1 [Bryobacteraceae bacterium]MDW8130337.1 type III-A CRISPR-associated protein Cas10/Csm1 [Bryobacterales bacterium]